MANFVPQYLAAAALGTLLCLTVYPCAAEADMSLSEISEATKKSEAIVAQVRIVLEPRIRNYRTLSLVDESNSGIEKCVAVYAPKNLGDLSERELSKLRECVARALHSLVEKMQRLKTLQGNAAFDYAVLSEAARLIANERVPARKALEKVSAMLERSRVSATDASQRLFLARFSSFTQNIVAQLSP
jgi:hypothetical protein